MSIVVVVILLLGLTLIVLNYRPVLKFSKDKDLKGVAKRYHIPHPHLPVVVRKKIAMPKKTPEAVKPTGSAAVKSQTAKPRTKTAKETQISVKKSKKKFFATKAATKAPLQQARAEPVLPEAKPAAPIHAEATSETKLAAPAKEKAKPVRHLELAKKEQGPQAVAKDKPKKKDRRQPEQALEQDRRSLKKRIAVMPFGSLTVGALSFDFTRLITDRLMNDKFSVISQDMLEGFLVKKRVRRTNFLDRATIREMGTALNADALMIGSVDVLAGGENPRIAMSAQMIDCVDSDVVWANSTSYTGADFATFLGIGKINSLQKLVEVAVTDLLKGLPAEVGVHDELARSFEIAQASFFPKVLKGGQSTNVSIEVREITGKPGNIKAFVLDTEVELETEDGRWYTGKFIAPTIEGVYSLKVYVTDQENRLFSMDGLAQLRVDNTPPEVSVSFRQRLISPNNDGIKDDILFFPELLNADILDGWTVEVADEAGTIVRSEEGIGMLPGGFVWRGEDNKFKRIRDGTYFCRLILEDKAGNRSVSPKETIVVDTTPPEVDLVLAAEDDKGITLELKTEDVNRIGGWELIIYDRKGNEAGKFEGNGDIPTRLSFALKHAQEGPNPEKEAFLAYSLEVNDIAGNRLEREKEPLKLPEPEGPEREPSEKKEVWIEDF